MLINMKRNIDFRIRDDEMERITLRFRPRLSHVHGFGDTPPKKWEEVYKTYFCYDIIRRWKDEYSSSEVMYYEPFDECSALNEVSYIIGGIITGFEFERTLAHPFGDGTSWEIEKFNCPGKTDYVRFTLFQSYTSKGYRFSLPVDRLQEFKKTLDYYLEYMLQHSEGI